MGDEVMVSADGENLILMPVSAIKQETYTSVPIHGSNIINFLVMVV
jgi:hypothetical protein